jgi:nitrogen regulatory protein PII
MSICPKYIAGFFDGEGGINIVVTKKKKKYALDYDIGLKLDLHQGERENSDVLQELKNWLENEKGYKKFRFNYKSGEHCTVLTNTNRKEVLHFCRQIKPYVIVKDRELELILEELVPILEKDEHLKKDGFIKVIEIKEEMSRIRSNSNGLKYDKEFFKELWNIEKE